MACRAANTVSDASLGAGEFAHDVRRRIQLFDFSDAKVIGIV